MKTLITISPCGPDRPYKVLVEHEGTLTVVGAVTKRKSRRQGDGRWHRAPVAIAREPDELRIRELFS